MHSDSLLILGKGKLNSLGLYIYIFTCQLLWLGAESVIYIFSIVCVTVFHALVTEDMICPQLSWSTQRLTQCQIWGLMFSSVLVVGLQKLFHLLSETSVNYNKSRNDIVTKQVLYVNWEHDKMHKTRINITTPLDIHFKVFLNHAKTQVLYCLKMKFEILFLFVLWEKCCQ